MKDWRIIEKAKVVQDTSDPCATGILINGKVYPLSGGNGGTKLSEFENDLFYANREPVLTIKSEEFTPMYVKDENGNDTDEVNMYYYKISPGFDWCRTPADVGFEATWRDEETGDSEVYTHYGFSGGSDKEYIETGELDEGIGFLYCDECGVQVSFGTDALNTDEIVLEDAFYVTYYGNDPWFSEITIVKNNVKKIPEDVLELGSLSSLIGDVNDLWSQMDSTSNWIRSLNHVPVFNATSTDGKNYTMSGDYVQPGNLFVVIPSMSNEEIVEGKYLYFKINGNNYRVEMVRYDSNGRTKPVRNGNFLSEGVPSLFIVINSVRVSAVTQHIPPVTSGFVTCETAANVSYKRAYIGDHTSEPGSTVHVTFTNGNTCSPITMLVGDGKVLPVVDRTGNAIATDAIKPGYVHSFVCDGNNWVLLE